MYAAKHAGYEAVRYMMHAMEADFHQPPEEVERDLKLDDGDRTRAAIWPIAWRATEAFASEGLEELFTSDELWGVGLVSTELYYAQPLETEHDGPHGKRSRSEMELSERGDAPPPVRVAVWGGLRATTN